MDSILEDIRYRMGQAKSMSRGLLAQAVKKLDDIGSEIGTNFKENYELWKELMLAYREIEYWKGMVALYTSRLPEAFKRDRAMQEQYAFALNRSKNVGDRQEAIRFLKKIIEEDTQNGKDYSETCGILARIYKDLYREKKVQIVTKRQCRVDLEEAIKYYRMGFERNTENYYTGINAATLMMINGESKTADFEFIIRRVLEQLGRQGGMQSTDYWVIATILEANILLQQWDYANKALYRIEGMERQAWMIDTTMKNLKDIEDAFKEANIGFKPALEIVNRMEEIKRQ